MRIKTKLEEEDYPTVCPSCKHELVSIEGATVKWIKCTSCKFKKLLPQKEKVIKITAIEEEKPRQREPKKVRFVIE